MSEFLKMFKGGGSKKPEPPKTPLTENAPPAPPSTPSFNKEAPAKSAVPETPASTYTPSAASSSFAPASPAPAAYESRRPQYLPDQTVIASEVSLKGVLTFTNTAVIDGSFDGLISSTTGNLIVGKNGKITANIEADNCLVEGDVKGNIKAKNKLELKSPSRLRGDITAAQLIIHDNVKFDGNCNIGAKSV